MITNSSVNHPRRYHIYKFVRIYQMVVTWRNPRREQLEEHLQSMPINRHGWLATQ
jgi:hypothetical protein